MTTCPNSPRQPQGHWWVIDTPEGPVSWGRCLDCGEEKEFRNSILLEEEAKWGNRKKISVENVADNAEIPMAYASNET